MPYCNKENTNHTQLTVDSNLYPTGEIANHLRRIGDYRCWIEPLPTGRFALYHHQSGLKVARTFTREEVEKLKGWEPPDIAPPNSQSMRIASGRRLLKAIDEYLDWQWEDCPNCGSPGLIDELCPPSSPHYAKLVCGRCNHHLRWLPCPDTKVRREVLQQRIDRLLPNSVGWDRDFLKSISSQKKLSPKQLQQVDRIEREQRGAK